MAGRRKGSPPLHAASMTVLERALTGRPSAASDAAPREEGGGGLPGKGRAQTTGGAYALPASKSLLSCSWGGGQPREPIPAAPVVKVRRLAVWHARRPRALQLQSAREGGLGGRTTGAYRAPAQCSLRNGRWGGGEARGEEALSKGGWRGGGESIAAARDQSATVATGVTGRGASLPFPASAPRVVASSRPAGLPDAPDVAYLLSRKGGHGPPPGVHPSGSATPSRRADPGPCPHACEVWRLAI